ncbi:hypothetical protein BSKO_05557 [Bryopsis sp. KO-2023]|nr:hypothetical protein BSKO_05557 [Bryopsis sp. KO-2023]
MLFHNKVSIQGDWKWLLLKTLLLCINLWLNLHLLLMQDFGNKTWVENSCETRATNIVCYRCFFGYIILVWAASFFTILDVVKCKHQVTKNAFPLVTQNHRRGIHHSVLATGDSGHSPPTKEWRNTHLVDCCYKGIVCLSCQSATGGGKGEGRSGQEGEGQGRRRKEKGKGRGEGRRAKAGGKGERQGGEGETPTALCEFFPSFGVLSWTHARDGLNNGSRKINPAPPLQGPWNNSWTAFFSILTPTTIFPSNNLLFSSAISLFFGTYFPWFQKLLFFVFFYFKP